VVVAQPIRVVLGKLGKLQLTVVVVHTQGLMGMEQFQHHAAVVVVGSTVPVVMTLIILRLV
jgi:hypothetical protein